MPRASFIAAASGLPRRQALAVRRSPLRFAESSCIVKVVAPLAQWLEQRPFKSWVVGSSPTGGTGWPCGTVAFRTVFRFAPAFPGPVDPASIVSSLFSNRAVLLPYCLTAETCSSFMRRARPSPMERASPSTDWRADGRRRCRWSGRPAALDELWVRQLRSRSFVSISCLIPDRCGSARVCYTGCRTVRAGRGLYADGAEAVSRGHPCRIRFRNGACPGSALHGDGPAAVQPGQPAAVLRRDVNGVVIALPTRLQRPGAAFSPHLSAGRSASRWTATLTARQEHQRPRPYSKPGPDAEACQSVPVLMRCPL